MEIHLTSDDICYSAAILPKSKAMRRVLIAALLSLPYSVVAQQSASQLEALPSGIARLAGTDPESGIAYTRLFLNASPPTHPIDLSLPTLTVQCIRNSTNKSRFELFVNFGNVADIAFYRPWKPSEHDPYPPRYTQIKVTMEFLGYTKVKPVKRDFEQLLLPLGQLHYNPPGMGSANLEEIAFYFQYLRALPTFRVTTPTQTATFLTGPLLAQIHKEPLCSASAL